ncbi:MAG: hypothetical protein ACTH0V_00110 [Microbacteriaceae bacterium]
MTLAPTDHDPLRTKWLEVTGDLIAPHDPFIAMLNAELFEEQTGLEPTSDVHRYDVVFTPLLPLPTPASYPDDDGNRSRFTGLKPDAAWNPLFWLPDNLRHPYVFTGENGEPQLEQDEEWQARVALELTASGLYDPDTGTWVDALATYAGLDSASAATLERVKAYLDGGEDELLDALPGRIAETIAGSAEAREEPMWAVSLSLQAPDTALAHRYLYSTALLEHLRTDGRYLTEDGEPMSKQDLAISITGLGAATLRGLDETIALSDGSQQPVADYLQRLFDDAEAGTAIEQVLAHAESALGIVERAGEARFPDEDEGGATE